MSEIGEIIETFRSSKEGVLTSCRDYLRCAQSLINDYVRYDLANKMPGGLEIVYDLIGQVDNNLDVVITLLQDEERNKN